MYRENCPTHRILISVDHWRSIWYLENDLLLWMPTLLTIWTELWIYADYWKQEHNGSRESSCEQKASTNCWVASDCLMGNEEPGDYCGVRSAWLICAVARLDPWLEFCDIEYEAVHHQRNFIVWRGVLLISRNINDSFFFIAFFLKAAKLSHQRKECYVSISVLLLLLQLLLRGFLLVFLFLFLLL